MFVVGLILGLIIGGFVGIFGLALCQFSKINEDINKNTKEEK